jgi:hypothetical protein
MPPVNFEPQSKLLRTLALSPNKQAAFNTALVPGAFSWLQRFDGNATFDPDQDRRSDKEYAGKNSWWATNGQITRTGLKVNGLRSELTPRLAAWLCAYCMGKVVTSGSDAPYSHIFTFDQSTRQAPVTSIYLEDTDDLKYTMADAVVSDFTWTIPQNGSITADYNLLGTGRYTQGAMEALPALADEDYFLGSDADLLWGNVGAATSTLGRLQQATLKVDHQHIDHRATGIGLNAGFIRKGDPKFDLQLSIYTKDTDDVFTRQVNNTKTAIAINVPISANESLAISVPSANIKTTKMGWDGDATIWQVELDETTCYLSGGAQPLTITITSSDPSFLTTYVAP